MIDRSGPSLRGRITTLAVLLLLSAAGLLVIFIADYAHRSADRAFDRLLAASALTIAGAVTVEDGAVVLELPFAAFAMFPGEERVFHAVQDPGGNHVTGYGDLAQDLPPATQTDPVFANGTRNGEQIRIVTVGRLVATARTTGWVTIRVAETRGTREALAAEILRNAMAPLAILTLLAVAFVWVVVGRAFRPLAILDRALRNRSPDDLSPVDVPVPVEVQQLVGGLNSFMARLLAAMERMSGLVAEAAHEVRNPLASLRAQAELALSEDDPKALRGRLERLHELSVHASHLVTQLLMDATISHRLERREWQDVPVGALAVEVAGRLDPDSRPRVSVDVGRNATRSLLRGDRVGLREMLRNLVENALAYSDGPVRIAADLAGDTLVLAVEDMGAGIPDEEKDEVVKRFARGRAGTGTVGSGLGLAIVMRVAAGHGGTLRLLDRPGGGLRAEIRLPLATAVPRVATAAAAFAFLLVLALPIPAALADPTLYPAPAAGTRELVIAGTTDTALFSRFIHGFQTENPAVSVMYTELDSLSLFAGAAAGTLRPVPDLLISSASDLQLLLANDGHGIPAVSAHLARVPAWAQWRREVVGFTFEPAVIIYNPDLLAEVEVPRTHLQLAELLEGQRERFDGRIATYDIARSGVGYLLASQDQQISSQFWRLAAAFGRSRAVLSDSSPAILDAVARGDLALGFNVLGSYAFARQAGGARIGIVVPDDYVLVLTRTLLIPRGAINPDLGQDFVDWALSDAGQRVAAGESALGSVVPGAEGTWTSERITERGRGTVQPIALGPVLLVALDALRRDRFLRTWQEIVAPAGQ